MPAFNLREYARRGAVTRIAEVNAELDAIYGEFPELREGRATRGRKRGRPAKAALAPQAAEPDTTGRKGARKRRGMSAAQRKAVSERMRKYWAGRRAATKR